MDTRTPVLGRVKEPVEPKWSTLPLVGSPASPPPISRISRALMLAEEKVASPTSPHSSSSPLRTRGASSISRGMMTPSEPPPLFRRSKRRTEKLPCSRSAMT